MKQKAFLKRCLTCHHYIPKGKHKTARCKWRKDDAWWQPEAIEERHKPLHVMFRKFCEDEKEQCDVFLAVAEGKEMDEQQRIENKKW